MEENIMKKRKILSALCAVVLGVTSIPMLTFANSLEVKAEITASDSEEITSDRDDNITYTLKDTEIVIKDGITSIESYAFAWCSNITDITIPDSVTSIGSSAFLGCTGLTKIIIPNSVTSIGDYAFGSCYNLTDITISDSVDFIGYGTFKSCSSLTEITIPDSVTSIGSFAFSDCTSLETITIENPDCKIYDGVYTIDSNTTIVGYAGSTAYDYAVKYNRKFIDIETGKTLNTSTATTTQPTISSTTTSKKEQVTLGDINGDGSVNSIDAVFVLKDFASQLLGIETSLSLETADLNHDGKINAIDAVIILKQYAQSLISK
jgi:hypothetical protein